MTALGTSLRWRVPWPDPSPDHDASSEMHAIRRRRRGRLVGAADGGGAAPRLVDDDERAAEHPVRRAAAPHHVLSPNCCHCCRPPIPPSDRPVFPRFHRSELCLNFRCLLGYLVVARGEPEACGVSRPAPASETERTAVSRDNTGRRRGVTLTRLQLEECESGRIGTTGNRVLGNQPWVQIPPPPPLVTASSPGEPEPKGDTGIRLPRRWASNHDHRDH